MRIKTRTHDGSYYTVGLSYPNKVYVSAYFWRKELDLAASYGRAAACQALRGDLLDVKTTARRAASYGLSALGVVNRW
jgi:hypothetical protein